MQRRRLRARDVVPGHVRHCSLALQVAGKPPDWFLYTWRRDTPEHALRAPYACQSWRCPECAPHESHVMYARIEEAIRPLAPDGWCFLVLTIDRHATVTGTPWETADQAFRELSRLSRNFMARLGRYRRDLGEWAWATKRVKNRKNGEVRLVQYKKPLYLNRWVSTVEAHRTGWPHVNVMVWSPALAAELRRERAEREARGVEGVALVLAKGELLEHATGAGWGTYSTAEAARSGEAVASYIVKLAGEAGAVAGELAKLSQLPTMAPERFRRLRSGKGFLPPRRKNPDYTGTLVRRAWNHDGTPLVLPLHAAPLAVRPVVVATCYAEEARMVRERVTRSDGELVGNVVLRLPPAGVDGVLQV